jgi:hypothetical protein
MVCTGKLHVVHEDKGAHSSTCGERYVKRFELCWPACATCGARSGVAGRLCSQQADSRG